MFGEDSGGCIPSKQGSNPRAGDWGHKAESTTKRGKGNPRKMLGRIAQVRGSLYRGLRLQERACGDNERDEKTNKSGCSERRFRGLAESLGSNQQQEHRKLLSP